MRFLLLVVALLLLPVLALVHRYQFTTTMQGQLLGEIRQTLSDPVFDNVRNDHGTSIYYLDVSLGGTVKDLATRERARALVRQIKGLRCREQDNHIQVPAQIEGAFDKEHLTLTLKGMLRDDAALRDITLWLTRGRPGLKVETRNVQVSPHVTTIEAPGPGAKEPMLQDLWVMIEVPQFLRITKEGDALRAEGFLQSDSLREKVVAALLGTRVETTLDAKHLQTGAYVKSAPFADPNALPAFLAALFGSQQNTVFEADSGNLYFRANVTEAMYIAWQPFLLKITDDKALRADLTFYPSAYHLPSYKHTSKLEMDAFTLLQGILAQSSIIFAVGSAEIPSSEMSKIAAVRQAVLAAVEHAPDLRIIIGGHPDTTGDAKASLALARRRAEAVVAEFADRGLSTRYFEVVPFTPSRAPGDAGGGTRMVEMLVK